MLALIERGPDIDNFFVIDGNITVGHKRHIDRRRRADGIDIDDSIETDEFVDVSRKEVGCLGRSREVRVVLGGVWHFGSSEWGQLHCRGSLDRTVSVGLHQLAFYAFESPSVWKIGHIDFFAHFQSLSALLMRAFIFRSSVLLTPFPRRPFFRR